MLRTKAMCLGFTLIELMSVMVIVLLLASLLLPAVSRVQRQGKLVQCSGNLHQIGVAMTLYAMDHDSFLPPYSRRPRYDHGGTNWGNYLRNYYQDVRILDCPASPDGPPEDSLSGLHLQDGNYGWNYDGTQGRRGPLHRLVPVPTETYLFFDSGDPCVMVGANRWENLLEELDLDWDSGLEGANRHDGCVAVFFVDGHVARLLLEPFLAAPCPSGSVPWCIEWEGGSLQRGTIPYPYR